MVRSLHYIESVPSTDTFQPQTQAPKNGSVPSGRTRDPSESAAATPNPEVWAHAILSGMSSFTDMS